jgi:hypothetical protein
MAHVLLYGLLKLNFSGNTMKLISSFLSSRKFRTSVKNKISKPTEILTGLTQGSVLTRTFYKLDINEAPNTVCHLNIASTGRNGKYLLRNIQRGFTKFSRVVGVRIIKLVKIRLRPSIFLVDMEGRSHILH